MNIASPITLVAVVIGTLLAPIAFAATQPMEATLAIVRLSPEQLAQYQQQDMQPTQDQGSQQSAPQVAVASTGLSSTVWIVIIAAIIILVVVLLVVSASRPS